MKAEVRERTCIGFGERDGTCTNPAMKREPRLWCDDCEKDRMAYLSRQFESITNIFRVESQSGDFR
jgi:hypothetical protein